MFKDELGLYQTNFSNPFENEEEVISGEEIEEEVQNDNK